MKKNSSSVGSIQMITLEIAWVNAQIMQQAETQHAIAHDSSMVAALGHE